jgi:hypothetical protein
MARFDIDRRGGERVSVTSPLLVLIFVLTAINTGLLFYFNLQIVELRDGNRASQGAIAADTLTADITRPPVDTTVSVDVARSLDGIRVQVLNGVGVPGIAATLGDRLARDGAVVVEKANASSFTIGTSRILLRREGLMPEARLIEAVMGVTAQIRREALPGDTLAVDLTVVIGADYR